MAFKEKGGWILEAPTSDYSSIVVSRKGPETGEYDWVTTSRSVCECAL